jgi:hypothetical protein
MPQLKLERRGRLGSPYSGESIIHATHASDRHLSWIGAEELGCHYVLPGYHSSKLRVKFIIIYKLAWFHQSVDPSSVIYGLCSKYVRASITTVSMTALAKTCSNCKRQTRPLLREGAPHQQTRNCLTVTKIWPWAPDGGFTTRQTGRLTIVSNIIFDFEF